MRRPVAAAKEYFTDIPRFADCMNTALFHGSPILDSENLRDVSADFNQTLEEGKKLAGLSPRRDILLALKESPGLGYFALFGIEDEGEEMAITPVKIML